MDRATCHRRGNDELRARPRAKRVIEAPSHMLSPLTPRWCRPRHRNAASWPATVDGGAGRQHERGASKPLVGWVRAAQMVLGGANTTGSRSRSTLEARSRRRGPRRPNSPSASSSTRSHPSPANRQEKVSGTGTAGAAPDSASDPTPHMTQSCVVTAPLWITASSDVRC